ncbi:MAG: 3-deoxy-manno-octulosonate cytidylyltransferase [Gammaproteobacteria bacterium]|nr:MAG: 3-deoxy-manno-octulosonate cytidylyltransferase [Gammaproteobacteria bacterium]
MSFKVVIPARYASSRLPGKPLLELLGKPMLQHVHERAMESGADAVVIATDDERIEAAARRFSADVCMTSTAHTSGTERLAEVVNQKGWDDSVLVVNLQGDEPLMPASLINQVATDLANHKDASITTLAYPLESSDNETDPNIVKVVLDREGYAMYFSRAPVPWHRDPGETGDGMEGVNPVLHHVGLYAYRAGFLKHFSELEQAPLEVFEKLEQLRALWHGFRIHVGITAEVPGPGVDTREDLVLVERLMTGD